MASFREYAMPFCLEENGEQVECVFHCNVYKGEPREPNYPGCPAYIGELRFLDAAGIEHFPTPDEYRWAEKAAWWHVKQTEARDE